MEKILTDFDESKIIGAFSANAVGGCKIWKDGPHIQLFEDGRNCWMASEIPFPLFNSVLECNFGEGDAEREVTALLDFYNRRGLACAWWVTPVHPLCGKRDWLEARGINFGEEMTVMYLDLEKLAETTGPADLEIREVLDSDSLRHWSNVMTPAFGIPAFARKPWFEIHEDLGLGPERKWRHFVGYLAGEPVSTSSLFLDSGVACVANVATPPEMRRRGYAASLTHKALAAAKEKGYRIGVLAASKMGENIYRRMGFTDCGKVQLYIHGAKPAHSSAQ